jgi:hypothetical protein
MNREGADACNGVLTPSVEGEIPVIFVGRDTGFALFDTAYDEAAACAVGASALAPIPIGTVGDVITEVGLVSTAGVTYISSASTSTPAF